MSLETAPGNEEQHATGVAARVLLTVGLRKRERLMVLPDCAYGLAT
jgi:hypothetical protein